MLHFLTSILKSFVSVLGIFSICLLLQEQGNEAMLTRCHGSVKHCHRLCQQNRTAIGFLTFCNKKNGICNCQVEDDGTGKEGCRPVATKREQFSCRIAQCRLAWKRNILRPKPPVICRSKVSGEEDKEFCTCFMENIPEVHQVIQKVHKKPFRRVKFQDAFKNLQVSIKGVRRNSVQLDDKKYHYKSVLVK